MNLSDGGGLSEETAAFHPDSAEPTVHEFVPGRPEQATRFLYTAIPSGVGYSLIASNEALNNRALLDTVAGEVAFAMNADAAVPGVTDIGETQRVKPLGSLEDWFNVAIESTSGRSETLITVKPETMRPDVFAGVVQYWRAQLDGFEATG